jgi:hypothetical protein
MKQSFYAIGILMLFASSQTFAQKNETAFLTRSSIMNSPLLVKESFSAPVAEVIVSTLAVERFRKDFKDVKNVEWVEISKGYRAYFQENSILTAVDYTKKGKLYSIIRYGKNLMTKEMKIMIEEAFEAPEIIEVSEVKIADYATSVYIIVLEDRKSMKTVQIIDDEMR